MKIVFVSNYLTLHQIPFCNEMYKRLGKDFCFIATIPMETERTNMGWGIKEKYPYEILFNHDVLAQKIIDQADIVLYGSAPENVISKRLEEKMPIVYYSERILKNGRWHALSPRAIKNMIVHHTRYFRNPNYLLCSSAYSAGDYGVFGAYWGKTYKWGYFPETKKYTSKQLESKKNNAVIQILWVGRLLKLKHPEVAIEVALQLRRKNIDFKLTIIGEGEQRQCIQDKIVENRLSDVVKVYGFMAPKKVREYMEKSNVFLFTSDFKEGWGAVLNEAMNSGCAVIASHAIGAAPYLIENGVNGYLYQNGNMSDMFSKIEKLAVNREECHKLGENAYRTIINMWNSEVAAERFIDFASAVANHAELPKYGDGPLSKAGFLSDSWFKS